MEPEQAARILIGPAKNKFFYDWNDKYEVWLGTRAMDGAPKETTMLVIVPKDKAYIAVNIAKEGWTTVAQFMDAVAQGTEAFLTHDANFACDGRRKWLTNRNWQGDGDPQWQDNEWMVNTSVEALLPVKRLCIEGNVRDLDLGPGHTDKKSRPACAAQPA